MGYDKVVFTPSPDQDADKACAGMVEKYNAFGILTNDTDFLIHQFSPDVMVFSIDHLNLETLDTKAYDRQKLANHLGLDMAQLPLFATIKGNDFISFKDLTTFHKSLVGNSRFADAMKVIPMLANYIRREGTNRDLDKLALRIFQNRNKAIVMQKSLDSYELTKETIENPLGSFDCDGKFYLSSSIRKVRIVD